MTEEISVSVIDEIFGKESAPETPATEEVKSNGVQQESEGQGGQEEVTPVSQQQTTETDAAAPSKKETPETNKVDYGALKQERLRRKELEKKIAEMEALLKNQQVAPTQTNSVANPQDEITFEKNPQEALRLATLALHEQLSTVKQTLEERQRQEEANREVARLVTEYQKTGQEYIGSNPDYKDAYSHLYKIKTAEFELMGMTPQQANKAFIDWEMRVGYDAYQNEMNPHEVLHELARRVGFAPSAPQEQTPQTSQGNSKLSVVKQGLQDNKNLPPSKSLTPEDNNAIMAEDIILGMNKKAR